MILENIRDKKLLDLYVALTKSDFKGYMNDTYVVRLLYGMLCFDSALYERKISMDKNKMLDFAKEVIRAYDEMVYNESDKFSIEVLTNLMIDYIQKQGKTYDDIHKMNSRQLKLALYECIEEE